MSAPDTAHSAVVTSHPFEPRDPSQPWGLCKVCRLAESTHATTTLRREEICEACGHPGTDLVEHQGGYWCPTVHRCDYNQNIGWINADIQAGIDAEMNRDR